MLVSPEGYERLAGHRKIGACCATGAGTAGTDGSEKVPDSLVAGYRGLDARIFGLQLSGVVSKIIVHSRKLVDKISLLGVIGRCLSVDKASDGCDHLGDDRI